MKLLTYIQGYLRIEISKGNLERFLNLCQFKGIILWEITRQKEYISCKVYVKDFKRMRELAHKSKCLIHIQEKHGFPFYVHKRQGRWVFLLGIIIAFFLLFFLSQYIWDVHVEGNSMYTQEMLGGFLEENGIYQGMRKKDIDVNAVEQLLKMNYERITWVSARISGTRLIIQIRENYSPLEITENKEKNADLITENTGTIVSIVTRTGVPKVKVGQKVKKGQILVSGEIPIENDSKEISRYEYVKADADIRIKKTINYIDEINLIEEGKLYTGKEKKKYSFRFLNIRFTINGLTNIRKNYDCLEEEKQFRLFEDFYLPFWFKITTIREYQSVEISKGKTALKKKIQKNLHTFIENLTENGTEVVEKQVRLYYDASVCLAKGSLTVIADEGKMAPITKHKLENKELGESE